VNQYLDRLPIGLAIVGGTNPHSILQESNVSFLVLTKPLIISVFIGSSSILREMICRILLTENGARLAAAARQLACARSGLTRAQSAEA
jgi:hypothetical protein